jgi:HAE1 family hydrophobic/amphiphilic exporter-1
MDLSELCIRRPVLTTLVTATFIVFGIFAYRLLPVAALPAVDFPAISVSATLPGASAENMAVAVAAPIERQMSTISGINAITSVSTLGRTNIVILFNLNRNIDGAALDVQTALTVAQRRLPIEMTVPPSFRKVNPADNSIVSISANSATLPLSTVNEYAEVVLAQQISQIPGVALVDIYGQQKFAIRVQVDPVAAAARNISLDEIRRVLISTNSNSPVGTLYGPQKNVTLLATSAMRRAEEYKDVVVAWRNGAPVKLQEVARVVNSVQALLLFNIGDQELTAGELRTRGHYLGSNVSYNLKKLVESGYIHHERSDADRRSVHVSLTEKGREIREVVTKLFDRHLESIEAVGNVTGQDFEDLNVSLRRLERFWLDQVRYRL